MISMRELRSFKALSNPGFDYVVSTVADEEALKQMNLNLLADLLNKHLPLNRYGAIRELGYIPVALATNDREQFILYNTNSREISISIGIDYASLLSAASPEEGTAILARSFLAAVHYFPKVPIPEFDFSSFRQDLEVLFHYQGWLNEALPNLEIHSLFLVWSDDYQPEFSDLNNHFFARRIAIPDCFERIDPASFIRLLNKKVHLSDFGQGISEIYLSFQADEADPSFDKKHLEYFPFDRELHITLPLDTNRLLKKSRRKVWDQMVESFLSAIPAIEQEEIPDFALEKFFKKVEEAVSAQTL